MKISYALTVCNELEEVKRLVTFLLSNKREEDEIVILFDDKGTEEVWNYLTQIEGDIALLHRAQFKNDFSQWKNLLTKLCTGDYIFQIDADELPNKTLIENLPSVLEHNSAVELYVVPRVNTVEGLTQEHLQKWKWSMNEHGWINWPDFQTRIYKNTPKVKWENKVHERLVGHKEFAYLPMEEGWALYHPKTIEKQEKQNNYYNTL